MEEGQVDADGELQWLGLGATQEPPPRRVKLQFFRPAAGKGKGKENAADIGKGKGKEKASDENDDDDTRQRKRPRTSSGWFSWLTGSSPASGARASTSRAGPSQFYQEEPWRPNWGFSAATAAWFATPDPDPAQLPGPSQRARSPSPELEYVDDDSAAHESDRDPLDED
ncbi:hypothetical protein BV22DRAFT_1036603 [Leucogyrophana mollusca]|uniref:Uncharacterized protein n=1 Tax=Leucogyrophana mollusca TaxID=85980 RepID=A0ACB8BBN5_9AGAM|nr:hypothetical protein BV22DRAFT_1036603 [Leucogyrophana mollusca]